MLDVHSYSIEAAVDRIHRENDVAALENFLTLYLPAFSRAWTVHEALSGVWWSARDIAMNALRKQFSSTSPILNLSTLATYSQSHQERVRQCLLDVTEKVESAGKVPFLTEKDFLWNLCVEDQDRIIASSMFLPHRRYLQILNYLSAQECVMNRPGLWQWVTPVELFMGSDMDSSVLEKARPLLSNDHAPVPHHALVFPSGFFAWLPEGSFSDAYVGPHQNFDIAIVPTTVLDRYTLSSRDFAQKRAVLLSNFDNLEQYLVYRKRSFTNKGPKDRLPARRLVEQGT